MSFPKAIIPDSIVDEYVAGASQTKLRAKYGIGASTVCKALAKAGVAIKGRREKGALHLELLSLLIGEERTFPGDLQTKAHAISFNNDYAVQFQTRRIKIDGETHTRITRIK